VSALLMLSLVLGTACLEEPDEAVDAVAGPGQPQDQPPQPRPPQPAQGQPLPGGQHAEPGSLPPLQGAEGPSPRAPGPLQVALVPSSRAVLLYKALVQKKKGGDEGAKEVQGEEPRRDAIADVQFLRPVGEALEPLVATRDGFKAAVGTFEAPIAQSSLGLVRVEQALLSGEVDCGVLPAAHFIDLADQSESGGQALVLVAQLGSAGGANSDLAVVVRAGANPAVAPKSARSGATEGLDARLVLSGLVDGQHQVLGDRALSEAMSTGTVDLVVAPRDLVQPALDAGTAIPFRGLNEEEAAPSAQVLACRVSTLGSEEARTALKALLRNFRGFLKRKGADDPTATGGRYPLNARVDVDVLRAMLATLKAQELVANAALEIVDLQALDEAGTPPDGPLGASSVLVDNRMVASHGEDGPGKGSGKRQGASNDLELPPPPPE